MTRTYKRYKLSSKNRNNIQYNRKCRTYRRTNNKLNNFIRRILKNNDEFTKYWEKITSNISDDDKKKFHETGNASTYGYMKVNAFQAIINEYNSYNSEIINNSKNSEIINNSENSENSENSNNSNNSYNSNSLFQKTDIKKKISQYGNSEIKTFYDLGSGLGMPNIIASLLLQNLEKSIGIELSSERTQNANIILEQFKRNFTNFGNNIQFINGSILSDNFNYNDADLIWISSLCFSNEIIEQLTTKLNNELKNGTHIFTSKELPNLNHKYHNKIRLHMSWTPHSETNHYVI